MNEEKRNRIAVAITINAVLLVFIIVAVLIAQIVQMATLSRRKKELLAQYDELVQELDDREDVLEKLQTDEAYHDWLMTYIKTFKDEDPLGILGSENN